MTPANEERGQVLVIVAVAVVILLGFSALVVDIGMAYAIQREERNLTDASSLAGAQELQQLNSRMVTAADRTDARTVAMTNLMNQLAPGDPLPACGFGADFTDCPIPGTDYVVSMRTPTANCVTCDDQRSLLVSLTRLDVGTFFAGLFGQDAWDIRQTSVAGIAYQARYAVITLRPPKSGNPNQNDPNVDVNGAGTSLTVVNGDIGTNTNLVSSGTVALDGGFRVDHYDDPQEWTSPPDGHHITNLIQDPNYIIPAETGSAGPFNTLAAADYTDAECLDIIEGNGAWPGVPANYVLGGTTVQDLDPTSGDDVTCFRPGRYNVELNGGNGDILLLTPGVYFLNRGADLNSVYLVGGWTPGAPGVAVVLNECNPGGGGGCAFRGEASHATILNGGTQFNNPAGTVATAALTVGGILVETNGLDPEIPLTLIVRKSTSPICNVQAFEPHPNCSPPKNSTLKLAGGGTVFLAGVQYAPTDNVSFSGGSAGEGYVGQIISWTVKYSGGTTVRQVYPGDEGNGIIRLDEACSGAGPDGMDNAACKP